MIYGTLLWRATLATAAGLCVLLASMLARADSPAYLIAGAARDRAEHASPTALLATVYGTAPKPADEPDGLQAARVCWLEATFRFDDCAAILGVIKRRAARAGVPFEDMLEKYSAIDAQTERAAVARELPDADVPSWGARTNRQWAKLRAHATSFLAGDVRDPCNAMHWGARNIASDLARAQRAIAAGRWVPARCSTTANAFYREVR